MKHIKIDQIKNGYIIEFYTDYPGPSEWDYTIHCETLEEVLVEIFEWSQKQ